MNIIQTVSVKQVLTEKSKQELSERFSIQQIQLQREIEQLRFERKKLEVSKKHSSLSLKSFDVEIEKREEKMKNIDFQIRQLHMLPLGSEIKEKEVQAILDIKIGDRWTDSEQIIIIKDGIVVEIR